MNNTPNNQNKKELNAFLYLFLVFVILQHLVKIFKNLILLFQPQSDFFIIDKYIVLYSIVLSIALIIVVIGTMSKKKWGVIGFFCLQIANLIGIQKLSTERQDLGFNFVVTCFLCVLFALLLLLRSNGKSAWNVIFAHTKSKHRKNYLFFLQNLHWFKKRNEVNLDKDFNVKEDTIIKDSSSMENMTTDQESKSATSNVKKKRSLKVLMIALLAFLAVSVCAGSYIIYRHYTSNEYLMNKANETFKKGEIKKALEMYEELADKKDYIPAKSRLGYLYIINDSVSLDVKKGIKYLEESSVSDSTSLHYLLCIYLGTTFKGREIRNMEKAKYYAEIAIKRDILLGESYFALGNYYADKEDFASAYYNWEKSSKYKETKAFDNLGWMTYNGSGCKVDMNKSYRYFQKALKLDSKDDYALYYMGLFYLNGEVVKQDKLKARDYFKQAADLGNKDAEAEYSKIQLDYPISDFSLDDP